MFGLNNHVEKLLHPNTTIIKLKYVSFIVLGYIIHIIPLLHCACNLSCKCSKAYCLNSWCIYVPYVLGCAIVHSKANPGLSKLNSSACQQPWTKTLRQANTRKSILLTLHRIKGQSNEGAFIEDKELQYHHAD